jgi:ParB family transcriptional regulator, chromosome partitioning protein
MKNRRGGLGRGLGALIPTGLPDSGTATGTATGTTVVADVRDEQPPPPPPPLPSAPMADPVAETPGVAAEPPEEADLSPVPGARFREIAVNAIEPNAKQPRQVFDDDALAELKVSIEQVGFLQPIVVREIMPGRYELVMGERRWRAAQALGRELIPAIIRDTRDDDMLRDALLENIHRANLNPLEEAAAYQQLLEEFGATHEELARRIGRSRPQISNTIRLLNLPPAVQRRVAAGVLSAGHARALLGLDDAERQDQLAKRIVAEGLSVRATEELVAVTASEPAAKQPTERRAKPHAPAITALADRLADRFDTKVNVDLGRRKGKIVIEFATVDDLERIVGVMGVDGRRRPDEE